MNPSTPKKVVLAVVCFVGVYALAALGGTIWLIGVHATAANVAIISGTGGVALGILGGLLASTRTDPVAEAQAAQVAAVDPLADAAAAAVAPIAPVVAK